jgi:hypothetical protein
MSALSTDRPRTEAGLESRSVFRSVASAPDWRIALNKRTCHNFPLVDQNTKVAKPKVKGAFLASIFRSDGLALEHASAPE